MYELLQGDCLELMKNIPDKSVDMILLAKKRIEEINNLWV